MFITRVDTRHSSQIRAFMQALLPHMKNLTPTALATFALINRIDLYKEMLKKLLHVHLVTHQEVMRTVAILAQFALLAWIRFETLLNERFARLEKQRLRQL